MREPDIRCEWLSGGTGRRRRHISACGKQATMIGYGGAEHPGYRRTFCAAHGGLALDSDRWLVRIDPLCRDPRPVSIFCGALAGALDPDIMAVLAKGDAASAQVALDLAEERGLHEGGYGPERYEEWAERDVHGTGNNPHVWLPVHAQPFGGDEPMLPVPNASRRCPCGELEREWFDVEADALGILPEWDACRACGAPQRLGSQRHCGAPACIERVGDDCHVRNCQRERGHDGLHMSRSAIHSYSGIEEQIDEWGDVETGTAGQIA